MTFVLQAMVLQPLLWNLLPVAGMEWMFYHCSSLTDLSPLASWNTSKVTDMRQMFRGCSSLSDVSALSSWNGSKVKQMDDMFVDTQVTTYPEWYKS